MPGVGVFCMKMSGTYTKDTMKYKTKRHHLGIIATSYGLLAIFLTVFDPYSLPVLLLLVPFALFFTGTFFLIYRTLLYLVRKLQSPLAPARCARIAFVVSGIPTFLILLQSIGQVGAYDIIVTCVLFCAADFYLARSKLGVFKATV